MFSGFTGGGILICCLCGPEVTPPAAEKVIRFGLVTDRTGPYSTHTKELFMGYQDCVRWQNDEYDGINGIPIDLLWADSGGSASKSISSYKSFMEKGVVGMLGLTSVEGTALLSFTEADKIPLVGGASTSALYYPPVMSIVVIWLQHRRQQ